MNKPTLDKVRDYFYGRCNDGEEVRLQQWFADNGNSSEADRLLGTLLDEVRSENPALAQAAFEEFCRRIGHSVPARTAPRRLTTVVRWTQRIAAVLIVPLLIAVSLLYTKTAHTPEWEEVLVPAGQRSELRLADGTLLWLNSGTQLHRRSFPAKRQAAEDGDGTSDKFETEGAKPGILDVTHHNSFYLGNAAAAYHIILFDHLSHRDPHNNEQSHPDRKPDKMFSQKTVNDKSQFFRVIQNSTVSYNHQPR